MYSTCLYCHQDLGRNAHLELFPIGRRLAFDAARGRLWVVCRRCGRWNLSPLEERWEIVEQCERLFRDTRLRVSTENIGLARAPDGTDLVRIGPAQRPELAAWRYGDQFGRRRRRTLVVSGITGAVMIPLIVTGYANALIAAVPGGMLGFQLVQLAHLHRQNRAILASIGSDMGQRIVVRRKHIPSAQLLAHAADRIEPGWSLRVDHDQGTTTLRNGAAIAVASKVLARLNVAGAAEKLVRQAVDRLESEGDGMRLFARIAGNPQRDPSNLPRLSSRFDSDGTLRSLAYADRLALEMATHEESERRALEGELALLEAEWREAEEIASIADSLVVPAGVEEKLRHHHNDRLLP